MRALRCIPIILWTVLILWLLTKDSFSLPKIWWLEFPHSDKLIHAGLFAVGGMLLAFAIGSLRSAWFAVILWAVVLGGGTEYLQHCCVIGRSGELADIVADVIGAVSSLIIVRIWRGH